MRCIVAARAGQPFLLGERRLVSADRQTFACRRGPDGLAELRGAVDVDPVPTIVLRDPDQTVDRFRILATCHDTIGGDLDRWGLAVAQAEQADPRLGAGDFDQSNLVARLKLGRDVEADRFGLNGRLPRSACDAVLGAHLNTSIAREATCPTTQSSWVPAGSRAGPG